MADLNLLVPEDEIEKQKEYMARIATFGGGKYKINTYGCQMNEHDSEVLAGMLEQMGYNATSDDEEADVILYNTCCVRDNAERRAAGNIGILAGLKKRKPGVIIGVCGCMMQEQGAAENLLKLRPYVNLIFGTHNLHKFPELFYTALQGKKVKVIEQNDQGCIPEGLPIARKNPITGYLTIMYGCNNFCSYCIVPYVRGRERSRSIASIVKEAEEMAKTGISEIMLLGQNVNSFGLGSEESFPKLLHELDGVVPRLRFMTSHPKDLSDALIEEMAVSKTVCPQFHLPVQSGSDRILSEMNRRYDREHYLNRVAMLRQAIPNVGLTTDIIAGFPGETEQDFEDTLSLVKEVRYDGAFTFIYSPRVGTGAAAMENQVPEEVKHERLSRLIALQDEITKEQLSGQVGSVQEVLIEGLSKRQNDAVYGRTGRGMTVNCKGKEEWIGHILPVSITDAGSNTLRGEIITKE